MRAKGVMVESQSHVYTPRGNPVQGGKCGGNRRNSNYVKDMKDHSPVHDNLRKIKDLRSTTVWQAFTEK